MSTWKPFEASAMSGQFILLDYRSREEPHAVMVDAINTDKRGMVHAKQTTKEAFRCIREAQALMKQAAHEHSSIHVAYAALHCLFAIRALRRESPVVFLVGGTDCSRASELLSAVSESDDDMAMGKKVVRTLFSIGSMVPNDADAKLRLQRERSWAWSADIPGIAMFVDVQPELF